MDLQLKGKTAVVTAAGKGIGGQHKGNFQLVVSG
jgi:hypothetical protein